MAPTSASWPLVGRTAELAYIQEALRDPATAAVLVQGAPGVGKTRLAEAVCHEWASTNATMIRISATREGTGFPLAALAPPLVQHPSRAAAVARDPVRLLADLQEIIAGTGKPPRLMFVDDLPLLDPARINFPGAGEIVHSRHTRHTRGEVHPRITPTSGVKTYVERGRRKGSALDHCDRIAARRQTCQVPVHHAR